MTFLQASSSRGSKHALTAAGIAAVVLALCLSGFVQHPLARALVFYAGVSAAYVALPYVRRADIPLVAMWVVMIAEFAPLAAGEMISPVTVAADIAGVFLATTPIYIARARQLMQGDHRPYKPRRDGEMRLPLT